MGLPPSFPTYNLLILKWSIIELGAAEWIRIGKEKSAGENASEHH